MGDEGGTHQEFREQANTHQISINGTLLIKIASCPLGNAITYKINTRAFAFAERNQTGIPAIWEAHIEDGHIKPLLVQTCWVGIGCGSGPVRRSTFSVLGGGCT